jgi:hypothetical protein
MRFVLCKQPSCLYWWLGFFIGGKEGTMKSNLIRSCLCIGMLIFSVNLAVAQSNILDTPFDDLYFLEYHNTYAHLHDRSGNDISLNYFLEKNYRDVELDAYYWYGVEVSHDIPWPDKRDSNCCPNITHDDRLIRCMQTILDWLDGEQGGNDNLIGGVAAKELPFIVNIEIKCGFKQVNDKMREICSPIQDKFFTPDDLMAYYEANFDPNEVPRIEVNGEVYEVNGKTFVSLREAVSKFGWPKVEELEGKIIVIYTGGNFRECGVVGNARDNNKGIGGYIKNSLLSQEHGLGIGFPCPVATDASTVYPNTYWINGDGERDFIVFNSMKYDEPNSDNIIAMSKEKNFLIRRYRQDPLEDSIIVLQFKDFVRKGGNIFAYENENLDVPWDSGPIPTVGLRDKTESPGDTGGGGGCFTSSF